VDSIRTEPPKTKRSLAQKKRIRTRNIPEEKKTKCYKRIGKKRNDQNQVSTHQAGDTGRTHCIRARREGTRRTGQGKRTRHVEKAAADRRTINPLGRIDRDPSNKLATKEDNRAVRELKKKVLTRHLRRGGPTKERESCGASAETCRAAPQRKRTKVHVKGAREESKQQQGRRREILLKKKTKSRAACGK